MVPRPTYYKQQAVHRGSRTKKLTARSKGLVNTIRIDGHGKIEQRTRT